MRNMQSCLHLEDGEKIQPQDTSMCLYICVCVSVCVNAEGSGMIKQSTPRYSMPSALPPSPPKKVLSSTLCISKWSLCTTWRIRMKEALSKRLILGRLVNASRLKASRAATPHPHPSTPLNGNGSPQVSLQCLSH